MSENKIIVTIGREFGSGGHEIGKRLAKALGINFYDHEFIAMAVQKTGYHEDYIKNNEEKAPDFATGALFSGLEFYQPSPFDKIQAEEYKLIKEIAARESCVIVGRAADYILQDQSHVSIFLFAPLEDRVNRKLALLDPEKAKKVTPAAMEKIVKQMDKQRRRYYEYYTDMKWGARDSYDLLINTSRAGIDGSVKIIKTYIEECRGESMMPD
ncbi:MAG: cytidylate kinase-like family protein [Mogibacterium sp.]|nr:cytidylate kinase-like family protein [Mogibacterium sp.]